MHVTQLLFVRIEGQKVKITCKSFNDGIPHQFEGTVIGDANTGIDSFIELDSGDIINTKYIESIKIVK